MKVIIIIFKHKIFDSQCCLCFPACIEVRMLCYSGNCKLHQMPVKAGFKFCNKNTLEQDLLKKIKNKPQTERETTTTQ